MAAEKSASGAGVRIYFAALLARRKMLLNKGWFCSEYPKGTAQGLNRLRKKAEQQANLLERLPAGALPKNSDFLGKIRNSSDSSDLGKTAFHLVELSPSDEMVVRKKFSRIQLFPSKKPDRSSCGRA